MTRVKPKISILGIRHHGPGSSRSLLRALKELKPDGVLIEGPPDADELIKFAAAKDMKSPAAILVHDADKPAEAVYYPFAEFSPEWQAMRWAVAAKVPVRFMDLPQYHRLAIDTERAKAAAEKPEAPEAAEELIKTLTAADRDPLGELAKAAGFDDGERWWEHVVEHNPKGDLALFHAIREAMGELRRSRPDRRNEDRDDLREAWMRRTIREAIDGGHQRIAVVCGAWHSPALDPDATPQAEDEAALKGLPKTKTAATWVPWTYDRLTFASGYGAGVHSPGWYEHLWRRKDEHVIESWMTKVAGLLRGKDLDCSSAHVIEAVRLSTTLASMRGRPLADLSDIADATRSVFCFDSDLPMRLIARELLVGDRLGEVPEDVPMVPLQQDLLRLQKALRLKPEALEKQLDLDLRNETDLKRSHLLHRLRLLGVPWGELTQDTSGKGTFREAWRLRWQPEYEVRLIEAGVLGTTIEQAATEKLRALAREASELPKLAAYLQDALLAELGDAAPELVRQIEAAAAVASDVTLLMATLPQLAALLRYGNVRQTDAALVKEIVDGIVPRITAGLGGAVSSLNDEAAAEMDRHLIGTNRAVELLNEPAHAEDWLACLARILGQDSVHGLIRGRCARVLFDAGKLPLDELARRLSQTLSRGSDPAQGARWLEGFLSGSGLLLLHNEQLLGLIDEWVGEIQADVFQELLPLLRRTFSTFPAGERRQIGQTLAAGKKAAGPAVATTGTGIDPARAARALSVLHAIFGGQS